MKLFEDPKPVLPPGIDFRCCDAAEIVAEYAGKGASLVFADPPWGGYSQRPGVAAPDLTFPTLPLETIAEHIAAAYRATASDARLVMWHCWPLVIEAIAVMRRERRKGKPPTMTALDILGRWTEITGGAWEKDRDEPGVGHHWLGNNEPVIVAKKGSPYTDRAVILRNTFASEPGGHSEKPVKWQADMIRRWVAPGGGVLDLYGGHGSVAVAVMEAGEGRWYAGAEVFPKRHAEAIGYIGLEYLRVLRERPKEQVPLFGSQA